MHGEADLPISCSNPLTQVNVTQFQSMIILFWTQNLIKTCSKWLEIVHLKPLYATGNLQYHSIPFTQNYLEAACDSPMNTILPMHSN